LQFEEELDDMEEKDIELNLRADKDQKEVVD